MDLYNGPVGPTTQVHDFSPGIPPSGLFWTQPIDRDSLQFHLGEGTASLSVSKLPEQDAHTIFNALSGGPTVASTASFDMTWAGDGQRIDVTNPVEGFTGSFMRSQVTIAWSAQQAGFSFTSDPADTTTTLAAVMGHEQNGVFFTG